MQRPAAPVVAVLVDVVVFDVLLALLGHFVQYEVDLMRREVEAAQSLPQPFLGAHLQFRSMRILINLKDQR